MFGGSAPKPAEDGEENEYDDPARKREWVAAQKKRLREHFVAEAIFAEGADLRPAWVLAPHVVVWAVPGGWAISGMVSIDHVVGQNDVLRSPRDAARYFGRNLRERSRRLQASKGQGDESESLARKAEAILTSVRLDTGWPNEFPLDEATLAPGPTAWQRADRLLAGPLFKAEKDPDLAPALRVLHRKLEAPGGPFYGVYFYLDVSNPTPQLFDALARKMLAVETQFAPLVAHRVQYALVFLGINFGMPKQEIEACRQSDKMRDRHPDLSRKIDGYSTADADVLPVHFVDSTDTPFTAHPCAVRDPNKPYTAEAKYFNCRDQAFHKSLESSPDVGLRLIAGSIDADVIAEARAAFRSR